MTLFHQGWIGLDGQPITGRPAPRTTIKAPEGVTISPQQWGQVAHAHKLFSDAVNASSFPQGYHVQNRTFSDGTRVRMTSNLGVHEVMVDLRGVGCVPKLPHGFVVTAPWCTPHIYARGWDGTTATWKFPPLDVPQAKHPITGTNQLVVPDALPATSASFLPHVHIGTKSQKWDLKLRKGLLGTATVAVPISMRFGSGSVRLGDYIRSGAILATDGTAQYTMTPPVAITVTPEAIQYLPGCTDGIGNFATLPAWREAVPFTGSPTLYNLATDAVTYDGATYSLFARAAPSFSAPVGSGYSSATTSAADIGENASDFVNIKIVTWGSGTTPFTTVIWNSGTSSWAFGSVEGDGLYEWDTVIAPWPPAGGSYAATGDAYRWQTAQTPTAAVVTPGVAVLPKEDGIDFVDWSVLAPYTSQKNWRGGYQIFSHPDSTASKVIYGVIEAKVERADILDRRLTAPLCSLDLRWAQFNVFEGTVDGHLRGRKHVDNLKTGVNLPTNPVSFYRWSTSTSPTFPTGGTTGPPYPGFGAFNGQTIAWTPNYGAAWMAGRSVTEEILAGLATPSTGSFNPPVVLVDEKLLNTIEYTLISRHLTDYDHRARFYAAIRVEVVCSGARWDQDPASFDGALKKTQSPTYTVNIYFEWNWAGTQGETLLTSGGCTRPGFEFGTAALANAFLYPNPNPAFDIIYSTPPQVVPGPEAIQQFKALTAHQGVNSCLAAEDYSANLTTRSAKGVEFSDYPNGPAPKKHASGMIYARTFKLSDFGDALWLLHSTACSAPVDNIGTTPWYYMPAFGAALSAQTYHIELRDGVLVQWSDDVPPKTTRPAPTARDLKLYRV